MATPFYLLEIGHYSIDGPPAAYGYGIKIAGHKFAVKFPKGVEASQAPCQIAKSPALLEKNPTLKFLVKPPKYFSCL